MKSSRTVSWPYDPAEADRRLDALGLTGRDAEGMREFPDGSRMTWFLDFTDYTGEGPGQFVVDDWGEGGRARDPTGTVAAFVFFREGGVAA